MVNKLLMQAFEKAQKETNNNTPNGQAKYLAKLMTEKYKSSITQKSMMRYYDRDSIPKLELQNALSKYLGYNSYEDYVRNNKPKSKIWIAIGVFTILIIIVFVWQYSNIYTRQNEMECMRWFEDHYEKVECNSKGISINYNQDWVDNFKKAQNDTIETFFKQGDTLYWYYKRNNKVELFTMPGKHPIRNVELKPITETIVRKYILKE